MGLLEFQGQRMNDLILVIENDKDQLCAISDILRSSGYDVEEALEKEQGVAKAKETSPDLIIMDLEIGLQLQAEGLKELKDDRNTEPDLIAMAEPGQEEMIIKFLRQGGSGYVYKPMKEIELLLFSVKTVLDRKELEKRNRFLVSQLKQVAIKDPLTDLYNYRHLHVKLSEEIIRSRRYNRPFCIFLVDIDDFKSVNRNFGHLAGDQVLKTLGDLLTRNIRKVDSVFRYGGDEFLILLPETHKDNALGIAMRLLIKIRETEFVFDGCYHSVTSSIGASMFPDKAEDKHDLLRLAEAALSRAKKVGGDTIFFA